MATVGQALTSPETGWQRIDDDHSSIWYTGSNWVDNNAAGGSYGTTNHYISSGLSSDQVKSNRVNIRAYTSRFRIILDYYPEHTSQLLCKVDGTIVSTINAQYPSTTQVLVVDYSFGSYGIHTIQLVSGDGVRFDFDAIDIDIDGYMVGFTKDSIASMVLGDRIPFSYYASSNTVGTFSALGTSNVTEIPASSALEPGGRAYFYHVGYDTQGNIKLVADRNIQFGIAWSTLNDAGLVDGIPMTISGTAGIMRLLSGGISATDLDNEWDAIIGGATLNGYITPGDDTVWHWSGTTSLTSTWEGASTYPVVRGRTSVSLWSGDGVSDTTTQWTGFRPVFLVPYSPNRFLVQVGTDIRTCTAGAWTSLGSIVPTEDTFKANGMASIPSLPLTSNATLLLYTQSSSPSATYSAKPLQSTLIPKALYTVADSVSKIQAPVTTVKFLITFDLSTYYKYNGTTLVAASTSTPADFMDYTTLNSIPSSLLQNSFALALLTPDSTDFSLDKVEVVASGAQPFSVEIAGNEVSPLSTNSERTIPLTLIPLGASTLTIKAGDVTATVPITREAIARQSVKRSIKSYEGGYQGTAPVSNVEIHTPLVSTPSFANPWGAFKPWFGDRLASGVKGVQKISAASASNISGVYRYTINSNKVRKIEVN